MKGNVPSFATQIYFVVIDWLTGIFDILGAFIGWMAIRYGILLYRLAVHELLPASHPEGYRFQAVICYTFFCGMVRRPECNRLTIGSFPPFVGVHLGGGSAGNRLARLVSCADSLRAQIMYFATGLVDETSTQWQKDLFVGAIVAGPIIYFIASALAYCLYYVS